MKNTNIIINYSYYNTSNINIHTTNSLQLTAAYQADIKQYHWPWSWFPQIPWIWPILRLAYGVLYLRTKSLIGANCLIPTKHRLLSQGQIKAHPPRISIGWLLTLVSRSTVNHPNVACGSIKWYSLHVCRVFGRLKWLRHMSAMYTLQQSNFPRES